MIILLSLICGYLMQIKLYVLIRLMSACFIFIQADTRFTKYSRLTEKISMKVEHMF